jgi:hypothetical protein
VLPLFLQTRTRRVAWLIGFALLFMIAGVSARALVGAEHGHVDPGKLLMVAGYPLVSAVLLLGWLLGRYPLIAILVLTAGIVSEDRRTGMSRLYAVRPTSLAGIYVRRFLAVSAITFALSALLLPFFDLIMLGEWAGYATLILIVAYIAVYGALCFLLSVWFDNEVWVVLALAIGAMIWDALLRAGTLADAPPGVARAVAVVLPPQGALFQLESAFGSIQPVPWAAFGYVLAYSGILFIAAVISLRLREH